MALRPSDVLHLYFRDIVNPKYKFGVLVSCRPVRFFLINSGLSSFVESTPDNRRAQLEIDAANHTFLERNSWVDCADWYDAGFESDSLETHVKNNPRALRGRASPELCQRIVGVVEVSRLLSPKDKEEIFDALVPFIES